MSNQVSVEYTCCGAQEFWPLNANGDLEMTHDEIGHRCNGGDGMNDDTFRDWLVEQESIARTNQDFYRSGSAGFSLSQVVGDVYTRIIDRYDAKMIGVAIDDPDAIAALKKPVKGGEA